MQVQSNRVNWGRQRCDASASSEVRCGRLLAQLHIRDGEIGLSSKTLEEEEVAGLAESGAPVSRPWTQWAVCTGGDSIDLHPSLPDLSVLAEVEKPFQVAAGDSCRVYIRIPVTVVFQVNDQLDDILAELPSESLSQEWFGGRDDGELCYRLHGALFPEGPLAIDESSIQAPVTIRNESGETLEVTQICLRVAALSIYGLNDVFWTNETLVRYQGGSARSRVSVKYGAPAEAPAAKLIASPREKNLTVVGRTFRSLRRWTSELLENE